MTALRNPGAALVALLSGLASTGVIAGEYTGIHPAMNSKLEATVGAYFSDTSGEVGIRLGDLGRLAVDYDEMGIDGSNTVPYGSLRWRFTDRWRLEANYFSVDGGGSVLFDRDIEWGDTVYEAGAEITSKSDLSLFRAAIGYSFFKSDRAEVGAGLGLHYLDWHVRLSGEATIDGEPVGRVSKDALVEGVAPNVALFADYAFNEEWLLTGRVDWLAADIGDISGEFWRFGATLQYQPFDHLGFGAGYDFISADVEESKGRETSYINHDIQGPRLFLTLSF